MARLKGSKNTYKVTQEKHLLCPYCDKALSKPSALDMHIKFKHPGKSMPKKLTPIKQADRKARRLSEIEEEKIMSSKKAKPKYQPVEEDDDQEERGEDAEDDDDEEEDDDYDDDL